jgi:Tfp pilus assembly protein PilN
MMSKINLLPWREEQKKIRNKVFYVILSVSIGITVIMIFLMSSYLNYRITVENANIQYINKELKNAKYEVNEVKNLRKNKKQLLERMNTIQSLQADRPSAVKLLDMIPRVLPEGLYLTVLTRKEVSPEIPLDQEIDKVNNRDIKKDRLINKKYNVTLQGVALTNGSISVFLKKLESIKWLSEIKLNEVSINKDGNGLNFNLEFIQNLADRE